MIVRKNLFVLFALLLGSILIPYSAKSQVSLGVGLAYGSDVKELGIEGRGYYDFASNKNLRLEANFTYFLVKSPLTFFTLDANLDYTFAPFQGGFAYALGGLDLAHTAISGFSGSSTELGLNLGVGVEGKVSFGGIFGEAKYVIGNASELVLTGGLRFSLR